MTVETVRNLIAGAVSRKEVLEKLDEADMPYKDLTDKYHYFNIRIPIKGGYIRIYDGDEKFVVQKVTEGGLFE